VSDADFFAQQRSALDELRKEVKNATSSMTAIPKPLKFLRASYGPLKACYNDPVRMRVGGANPNKPLLADVLSMLAMTQGSENREVLAFRLLGSQVRSRAISTAKRTQSEFKFIIRTVCHYVYSKNI